MKLEDLRENERKRTKKEFESFKKRIESTKHCTWFISLTKNKQFSLYLIWKETKFRYKKDKKQISFRKFIFNVKSFREYFVHKIKLRDSILNNILK